MASATSVLSVHDMGTGCQHLQFRRGSCAAINSMLAIEIKAPSTCSLCLLSAACYPSQNLACTGSILQPLDSAALLSSGLQKGSVWWGTFDYDSQFDWGHDYNRPNHSLKDLVIYEMSVRCFTASKSSGLPTDRRGTYLGVADKVCCCCWVKCPAQAHSLVPLCKQKQGVATFALSQKLACKSFLQPISQHLSPCTVSVTFVFILQQQYVSFLCRWII